MYVHLISFDRLCSFLQCFNFRAVSLAIPRLRPENHQMQANLNDYYARPG